MYQILNIQKKIIEGNRLKSDYEIPTPYFNCISISSVKNNEITKSELLLSI